MSYRSYSDKDSNNITNSRNDQSHGKILTEGGTKMSQESNKPSGKKKKTLTAKLYKTQTGAVVSEKLKERNKHNNKIKRAIFKVIEDEPRTVPEISLETGIPSHEVLWHVATSLRYRLVEPVEKTDEDYWRYRLIK